MAAFGDLDVAAEFSPRFQAVVYKYPGALSAEMAPNGAVGANRGFGRGRGSLHIELQRAGDQAIVAGIVLGREDLWRAGLNMFDWGFARQSDNGGFERSGYPFHSSSFFVAAVAHASLFAHRAAATGRPVPAELLTRLDDYRPRLQAAARWMAEERRWRDGQLRNRRYAHRRFVVGAAMGLTGRLTGDLRLIRRGRESIRAGISRQRPDGVNPERGGHDSSYQMLGLIFAQQWLAWSPRDRIGRSAQKMIRRGLWWSRSRVTPGGLLRATGNTRTNGQERHFDGRVKRVGVGLVVRSMSWWGVAFERSSYLSLARRVRRAWDAAAGR